jgi:hypothetical protein
MGWMGTAGSLGRIALPALSGIVSTSAIFALSAVLAAAAVALLWRYTVVVRQYNTRQLIDLDGITAA